MKKIEYKNKKAFFKFEFIEKYTAGIVLTGTEIKSIRDGKISFTDSYCVFKDNELWVTLDLRRGSQGPALVASGKASPHASSSGAFRNSSPADAGA